MCARKVSLLCILLALLATHPWAAAAQLPWAYVVWESPAPLTEPRQVEIWGDIVEVYGNYIGEDRQHGTLNVTYTSRCWSIVLRSGSFVRTWWERRDCSVYSFPWVGVPSPRPGGPVPSPHGPTLPSP